MSAPYRPRHAYVAPQVLTVKVDTSKWDKAFQQMNRDLKKMREQVARSILPGWLRAMARLMAGVDPQVQILAAKMRHGAGNIAGDGTWLSDMCAAWVHGSCPLPGHCDCGCHR